MSRGVYERKMAMETINVSDLPESIAQAIEAMVSTLRQQFQAQKQNEQSVKLPVWEGKPFGKLTSKSNVRRCHMRSLSWIPAYSLMASIRILITTRRPGLYSTKPSALRMPRYCSTLDGTDSLLSAPYHQPENI